MSLRRRHSHYHPAFSVVPSVTTSSFHSSYRPAHRPAVTFTGFPQWHPSSRPVSRPVHLRCSAVGGAKRSAPTPDADADHEAPLPLSELVTQGDGNTALSTAQPITLFNRTVLVSGRMLLMLVPIMWASYAVSIKLMYLLPWSMNPILFNATRLGVASLLLLPMLVRHYRSVPFSLDTVLAGSELGFWTCVVNLMQIFGLRFTSASRGTFLSQLCTIIVPFLSVALGVESGISPNIYAASITSVGGVALLCFDDVTTPFTLKGDGLLLASAFAAAMYVIRSKCHASHPNCDVVIALKVATQFLFSVVFFIGMYGHRLMTSSLREVVTRSFVGATPFLLFVHLLLIMFNGIIVGWYGTVLQLKGQKLVSASEAVVIFTTTPLWSAALAIPLGERFGFRGIMGACLIMFSTLLASRNSGKKQAPLVDPELS